jgi:arsenate reductase
MSVENMSQSVRFYSTLFAAEPAVEKPDYAKWMLDDPRVNFAISARGGQAGLDHLGIQVETPDELQEVYGRLEQADRPVLEEGATTCCYAKSEKAWIADPQGISWETFLTSGTSTVYGDSADLGAIRTASGGLVASRLLWSSYGMTVTIYHNPACGTSRNVLALIRNTGQEPRIIEYLKTPPSREELVTLIERMGISVRALLRRKGTPYDELNLDNGALTDGELIDAMLAHPILINRPIVVTPVGVALCRPSEAVLDILPQPQRGPFIKEDGEAVIDASGRRIEKATQ